MQHTITLKRETTEQNVIAALKVHSAEAASFFRAMPFSLRCSYANEVLCALAQLAENNVVTYEAIYNDAQIRSVVETITFEKNEQENVIAEAREKLVAAAALLWRLELEQQNTCLDTGYNKSGVRELLSYASIETTLSAAEIFRCSSVKKALKAYRGYIPRVTDMLNWETTENARVLEDLHLPFKLSKAPGRENHGSDRLIVPAIEAEDLANKIISLANDEKWYQLERN